MKLKNKFVPWIGLLGMAAAISYIAVRLVAYVAEAAPPFGYFYDLGVHAAATDYILRAVRSSRDLRDILGWSSWGDVPSFWNNPSLTYFVLAPIAHVIHSTWTAIKVLQIVELFVAALGASALYRTIFGARWSALIVGLLYAFAPPVALGVRGNLDIGWTIAIAPGALAAGIVLIRRFGSAALPLCGIVCAFGGYCFAAEYLFFTSLPLYAFLAIYAFIKARTVRTTVLVLSGLLTLVLVGSFFVLPTLFGARLFTAPQAHISELQAGSQLFLFGQSLSALLSLVPQENLVSTDPAFNSTGALGLIIPSAILVWLFGIVACLDVCFKKWNLSLSLLLSGAVLIGLSLGTRVPFGEYVWRALQEVPLLIQIRTPDRFIIVPILLVIVLAGRGLLRCAESRNVFVSAIGVLSVFVVGAGFIAFAFNQHCFTSQSSMAESEPDLLDVDRVVNQRGGRTLSLGYVRGGSQFFTATYGVPEPTLWFAWDLIGRYDVDGLFGLGIMARDNVRSVVVTPNWTSDAGTLPPAAAVEAAAGLRPIFRSGNGIGVFAVDGNPPVVATNLTCVDGGPGLLDEAASLSELHSLSFVRSSECASRIYLNYVPSPVDRGRTFDAKTLFPNRAERHDADYHYIVGRAFINDTWYRDAVDGDSAISPSGGRSIGNGASATLGDIYVGTDVPELLALRFASSCRGRFVVLSRGRELTSIPFTARPGFNWYTTKLMKPRLIDIKLLIEDSSCANVERPVVFDVARVGQTASSFSENEPASGVLTSLDRWQSQSVEDAEPSVDSLLSPVVRVQSNGLLTRSYRWLGPDGNFVLNQAVIGNALTVGLGLGAPARCCSIVREVPSEGEANDDIIAFARLRTGDLLTIRAASVEEKIDAADLPPVLVFRTHRAVVSDLDRDGMTLARLDATGSDPQLLTAAVVTGAVSERGRTVVLHAPTSAAYAFRSEGSEMFRSVQIVDDVAPYSDAMANLSCGNRSAQVPLGAPETRLSLFGEGGHGCRLTIRSSRGDVDLRKITYTGRGARPPSLSARLWLPAGKFAALALAGRARESNATVSIDGKPPSNVVAVRTPGWHSLKVSGLSANASLLAFIPREPDASALSAVQHSVLSWHVTVPTDTAIAFASFDDGNWIMRSSRTGRSLHSVRCNLIMTCFPAVSPGDYTIWHRWPRELIIGLAVSAATVLFSLLLIAATRRRSEAHKATVTS